VAEKVEAAIFAAADRLGEHPKFGSKTDEANVRRWPMIDSRYTILYVIDREAKAIDVLRIMDARRVRDLKRVPR
jgi:plasmid stabilization system protein ParE